mmetsp:Transcript_5647/g.11706  ORF Transcript_5647/g.11706 Transcript_5647/m.11706 type:complete len:204 (-) Transcript_5647:1118-1729(-)
MESLNIWNFLGRFLLRCHIKLDKHSSEFFIVEEAILIFVEPYKHFVDLLFIDIVVATELKIWFCKLGWRSLFVLSCQISCQSPSDLLDEVFSCETRWTTHVACSLPVAKSVVQSSSKRFCVIEDLILGDNLFVVVRISLGVKDRSVFHRSNHCLHQTKGIQRCFLSCQMKVPQVRHSSVRRLEFFNQRAVIIFADQVTRDETR